MRALAKLAAFAGASEYANQGQRVVEGQRLMQAASDIFTRLAASREGIRRKAARLLRPPAAGLETLPRHCRHEASRNADLWRAWTLARAHARSGESIAIAAYLGKADPVDQAITEFAAAYADQNERDCQALATAAATGRITAHSGLRCPPAQGIRLQGV
ncbi:MAG: DUF2252 domain-containing protein [Nocardiopsaceae bacterium]|nr:DUF2252 domain-containing protein [Nocardiopsaceae bacterium]